MDAACKAREKQSAVRNFGSMEGTGHAPRPRATRPGRRPTLNLNTGSRWNVFAGLLRGCGGSLGVWFRPVRTAVRDNDGPHGIITAYAGDAALRRHDRSLTIVFALIVAAVIAGLVALALEPDDVQVAAIAPPAQIDPCGDQTWPHFTASCIASRSKPATGGR